MKNKMKNPIEIQINRSGMFYVTMDQAHKSQCGRMGTTEYNYEVSITGTEECLYAPDMFLMDNLLIKDYFDKTYEVDKCKCHSCEMMAIDAIKHFMVILAEKNVQIKRIDVIIKGSKESFIKATWSSQK